jgi:MerR HTH family regulatory protein
MEHTQASNSNWDELMMTSEAARTLEVARETILLWERNGKLPAMKTTNGRDCFGVLILKD